MTISDPGPKLGAADVGTWFEGGFGHDFACARLVDYASRAFGLKLASKDKQLAGRAMLTLNDLDGDEHEMLEQLSERAHEAIAPYVPEGFTLAWIDGDYGMWPDD